MLTWIRKLFAKEQEEPMPVETIDLDLAKRYRVLDVALEIFLADWASWHQANFLTADGRTVPSGLNAFAQDRQRFTDWSWQIQCDQLTGLKMATYREVHANDPRPAPLTPGPARR